MDAVFRFFSAVLIAMSLSACGGGGGSDSPSPTPPPSSEAPFKGTAIDRGTDFSGQPRRIILTAGSSPRFSISLGQEARPEPLAVEAQAGRVMAPDELMDGAERLFPALFPSHQSSQEGGVEGKTFRYRYYPETKIYLGVVIAGPGLGHAYTQEKGILTDHGTSAYWTCQIDPARCGPTLTEAKFVYPDGKSIALPSVTKLPAKGGTLTTVWSEPLACSTLTREGKIGHLFVKISCEGNTLRFIPGLSGEERWPFGSEIEVEMTGIKSISGLQSPTVALRFTTAVFLAGQGYRVYTVNVNTVSGQPIENFTNTAVSILDRSGVVGKAEFPKEKTSVLWWLWPRSLALDTVMGVGYLGGLGHSLYRFDLETGAQLAPAMLNLPLDFIHVITGIAIQGEDVCVVTGRTDFADYLNNATLICWNRYTLEETFRSVTNYVTTQDMTVIDLVAVPEHRAYYAVAYETKARYPVFDPEGIRDEITPGTKGMVVEIDSETKAIKRTFPVGAGPLSLVYDASRERLITADSGDRTLSLIDLKTGNVTKLSFSAFTRFERPRDLAIAGNELWVANSVNHLVGYDLTTLRETRRLRGNGRTEHVVFAGGLLYSTVGINHIIRSIDPQTGVIREYQGTSQPEELFQYTPAE